MWKTFLLYWISICLLPIFVKFISINLSIYIFDNLLAYSGSWLFFKHFAFNFKHHSFTLESERNVIKDVQVGRNKRKWRCFFSYKGMSISLKLLLRKLWSEWESLKYAHEMFCNNNTIDTFVCLSIAKKYTRENSKQGFSSFIANMCTLVHFLCIALGGQKVE